MLTTKLNINCYQVLPKTLRFKPALNQLYCVGLQQLTTTTTTTSIRRHWYFKPILTTSVLIVYLIHTIISLLLQLVFPQQTWSIAELVDNHDHHGQTTNCLIKLALILWTIFTLWQQSVYYYVNWYRIDTKFMQLFQVLAGGGGGAGSAGGLTPNHIGLTDQSAVRRLLATCRRIFTFTDTIINKLLVPIGMFIVANNLMLSMPTSENWYSVLAYLSTRLLASLAIYYMINQNLWQLAYLLVQLKSISICLSIQLLFVTIISSQWWPSIPYIHNLTVQECGRAGNQRVDDNGCFPLHLNHSLGGGGGSQLSQAHNASAGDAPWAVLLKLYYLDQDNQTAIDYCSGSIIGHLWIITAGHCVSSDVQYVTVYTGSGFPLNWTLLTENGTGYNSSHIYQHPLYHQQGSTIVNDIGLIKLNTPIRFGRHQPANKGDYDVNALCLPPVNVTNGDNVWPAYVAGYGASDIHGKGLQVGRRDIQPYFDTYGTEFLHMAAKNQTARMCDGDSGAGLWLYWQNRAVLVGLHKSSTGPIPDKNNCVDGNLQVRGESVSMHMDWIIKVING
ncbi:uncharacterized protein LOC128965047 [Oppia nitens]|uniref:uncharacterized protein LOC128965047 n=1 Tax=Oppia nitens TaxID=1686743 RepID=UPI0023DA8633|nr:uncharacterized protein LOC128965047 [Oppia nitens]